MRRGIKGAAFAAALGALATTGHVGTASALQIAECIDPIEGSPSSPSQGCNAAVVAVSSILRAEVSLKSMSYCVCHEGGLIPV